MPLPARIGTRRALGGISAFERLKQLTQGGYFWDGITSLSSGAIASWAPVVGVNAAVQAVESSVAGAVLARM